MQNRKKLESATSKSGVFSFNGISTIKQTGKFVTLNGIDLDEAFKQITSESILDLQYTSLTDLHDPCVQFYTLKPGVAEAFTDTPPQISVVNLKGAVDNLNTSEYIQLLSNFPDTVKIVYLGRKDRYLPIESSAKSHQLCCAALKAKNFYLLETESELPQAALDAINKITPTEAKEAAHSYLMQLQKEDNDERYEEDHPKFICGTGGFYKRKKEEKENAITEPLAKKTHTNPFR